MNALAHRTETDLPPALPMDFNFADLQSALAGDLNRLTPEGRVKYYNALCNFVGLNPLGFPFAWLTFQGKLVLYPKKECADQLRAIHKCSVEILERKIEYGTYCVLVRVTSPDGRTDVDEGRVAWNEREAVNVMKKALTQAKRRATLSMFGLAHNEAIDVESEPVRAEAAAQVLNGGESVADRAIKLNAALSSAGSAVPIEAESLASNESEGASRTGEQQPEAGGPVTQPVPAPQTGQTSAPTPSAPAAVAGLLDDETVFNLQTVLSEGNVQDGVAFLIAKKKLARGAGLNTLPADAAKFILQQSRRFHQMVEEWVRGGRK